MNQDPFTAKPKMFSETSFSVGYCQQLIVNKQLLPSLIIKKKEEEEDHPSLYRLNLRFNFTFGSGRPVFGPLHSLRTKQQMCFQAIFTLFCLTFYLEKLL